VSAKRRSVIQQFIKHAKVPGFRPGKVPPAMIERRHAADIKQELDRVLVQDAYEKGLKASGLKVFGIVEVQEGKFQEGEEGRVTFVVDVEPEFELPEYKGIAVQGRKIEVTEAEIDSTLDLLRSERAEFNVVEREAQAGDYVKCSYEGKVGETLIADLAPDAAILGTQSNTWEEAGNSDAPGVQSVVSALVGMKAGDETTVNHTFAADHPVVALQGSEATYSVSVHEVRERVLPPIDEEFLKSIKAESLESLRANIRSNLEGRKRQDLETEQRRSVVDHLMKAVDFEIPASAFEQERDGMMERFAQRHLQRGAAEDEIKAALDQQLQQVEEMARIKVKEEILLMRIAKEEKISVTSQELSTIVYHQAMQARVPVDKFVKELKSDEARLNSLRQSALLGKTVDFLVDAATVTEVAE
jgi:trigger factor